MKKYYIIISAFLMLNACSKQVDFETMSAEEIYNYAMNEMEQTRYAKAETAFETLETDHPYSQWAVKSKLMGAYAYYKDEKYDDAIMAIDRFIKYHPGNKDVPYALYLKGMCYYDQISAADKDQGNTQKAEEAFALLTTMFPDSEYAKDASGKLNLTEDYKAGQEMIVGRYYLHEGNYLSALNRFNVVLENYQQTIQIEEALYRQVEIYAILGLNKYADGYYKILQKNYPEGKWTEKAAKVMKKIGVETKPSKVTSETEAQTEAEDAKTESKGWFGGWFGGNDDKAENTAAEIENTPAEAQSEAEDAKTESKGWFSGWFGGNDDKAENTATEIENTPAEAQTEAEDAKTESKGWFSGWFGGNDIAEDMAQSKKDADVTINETLDKNPKIEQKTSWFSGWFGNKTSASEDAAE